MFMVALGSYEICYAVALASLHVDYSSYILKHANHTAIISFTVEIVFKSKCIQQLTNKSM